MVDYFGNCCYDSDLDVCGECFGEASDISECGCDGPTTLSLGSASVNAGDIFDVDLSLCNDDLVAGFEVNVQDSPSQLDAVDVVATDRL